MRAPIVIVITACFVILASPARGDQVQMQNGDRYAGKILSTTSNSIVMESDVLGKVTLPRDKVSAIMFGSSATSNTVACIPVPRVSPDGSQAATDNSPAVSNSSTNLAAAFQSLGANTNFIEQVREQMLSGANPAAKQKYDELLNGLMTGKISVNDLRGQAQAAIGQINQLKTQLGPQADESLDAYLTILQDFVNETTPTASPTVQKPAVPAPALKTNATPVIPNR